MSSVLLISLTLFLTRAEPFKPATDSFVVDRVPKSLLALRQAKHGAVVGNSDQIDQPKSLALAREYLEIAQRTSDPAFVRYADKLLLPWNVSTNAEALFLRAVISQHLHAFDEALDQLDHVLRIVPGDKEASLMKASILATEGKYAEAKKVFAGNLRLTSSLRGLSLFLNVTSLSGALAKSEETLERSVSPRANPIEGAFAWCTLAEMAVRRGDEVLGEARFKKALALEPNDSYTLTAYADLLIRQKREREVMELIEADAASEALLTRRFLVTKTADATSFAEQLKASGHFRELAMLDLNVMHNPVRALENALLNWQKQKEPIDSILVLRTTLACDRPGAAEAVKEWLVSAKTEDRRMAELLTEFDTRWARK